MILLGRGDHNRLLEPREAFCLDTNAPRSRVDLDRKAGLRRGDEHVINPDARADVAVGRVLRPDDERRYRLVDTLPPCVAVMTDGIGAVECRALRVLCSGAQQRASML